MDREKNEQVKYGPAVNIPMGGTLSSGVATTNMPNGEMELKMLEEKTQVLENLIVDLNNHLAPVLLPAKEVTTGEANKLREPSALGSRIGSCSDRVGRVIGEIHDIMNRFDFASV